MKVTKEKTENYQVFLSIEMEPAEVEESLEATYKRLVKKTKIPGFRQGKAPRAVLERYMGKESLLKEALSTLVPQACEKAIKEQKIEAIAQPEIEISQTEPVVFKATVPLKPTIELGDFQQIRATPKAVEVTKDEMEAVIERLRHQVAIWEPVERAVEFNDLVVLDIESSVDGEPFINQKGVQYQVLPDLPTPVPGFAEQVVELKKNEEKEFKLPLPSDYPRSELAGKEASFKVTVTEIKQEKLPKLNNKFAKQINPDFKTLASLRKRVSSDLRQRAEEKAKTDFEDEVVEATADLCQVEFPPILVEAEIGRLINQQARRLQMGGANIEQYLNNIGKTEAELREELRPVATNQVTQSLVLGKIAEEEKIEAGDAEVSAEIEKMTQNVTQNKDELEKSLNTPQSRESIERLLITRKTIQRLAEIAGGSAKQIDQSG